jgi:hypothetical protein
MSMLLMVKAMQSKVGNPLRKLVLLKLADNANDQGECWPSYQYIADQCEMSKRSVMAHIDALIDSGFLRKELRLGGEKGNKSNVYTLRIPSAGDSLGVVQQIHQPSAGDSLPPSAGAAPRTSHSLEPVNKPNTVDSNEPTILQKDYVSEQFARFWRNYPNPKAKAPAEKAFRRFVKGKKESQVRFWVDLIINYHLDCIEREEIGAKALHASTLINQKRWEDDPEYFAKFKADWIKENGQD